LNKYLPKGKANHNGKKLVRPHAVCPNMKLAYAQMSKDKKREADALDWAETTFKDIAHEKR
jgi:hypothetical protein